MDKKKLRMTLKMAYGRITCGFRLAALRQKVANASESNLIFTKDSIKAHKILLHVVEKTK
jgi:hypothetical protein